MNFKFGGSLPPDDSNYIERQADEDLYQHLLWGEYCYVLNSRQTGKSSLMLRTMQKLEAQGIACGKIDMSIIGGKRTTLEQWYFSVMYSICDNFKLLKFSELRNWQQEHKSLSSVQRLKQFIDKVLLKKVSKNIIIFIDEIDSILSLDFEFSDFFALIRNCYQDRSSNREYKRLTFAIFGVATPNQLIRDLGRTSFNIGHAIKLHPFSLDKSLHLAQRLTNFSHGHRNTVLAEIFQWTGGQPFLTLKLCQLVLQQGKQKLESPSQISTWVQELVQEKIIDNWKTQDEPQHFRTIKARLTRNQNRAGSLLGIYQQLLQQGQIEADSSEEEIELLLSGIVLKQNNNLVVYNPIYQTIFNQNCVDKELAILQTLE